MLRFAAEDSSAKALLEQAPPAADHKREVTLAEAHPEEAPAVEGPSEGSFSAGTQSSPPTG